MKKSTQSFIAIAVLALASAGFAFAADKAESKPGKCCVAAAKDGKSCAHACCVAANKEGNNCTKCGGAGKLATKAEAKK
ncbi:MAG: hypothetical protein B9S34_01875 [Opitutia bacterium Tous-C1TDCM]|nr:MAG: hypothetical protein B9S34_01875 [Opitutae bacterium Tous-C1TDCM]